MGAKMFEFQSFDGFFLKIQKKNESIKIKSQILANNLTIKRKK